MLPIPGYNLERTEIAEKLKTGSLWASETGEEAI